MLTFEQLTLNQRYQQLPQHLYSVVKPAALPEVQLLHFNTKAAELIQLSMAHTPPQQAAEYLSGNRLFTGSQPLAALYAGHQFGHFVPQLGDGRAMLLGDVAGEHGHWELQLKGSGPTPYSRRSDGRAVLRSSLREYLCSEAMHALGVPTTRALSLVGSSQEVYRESVETAAVVMRMSPSFVRFGSFEVLYHRGLHDDIRTLADFVIAHHFPQWQHLPDRHILLLREVVASTARLMAHWQAVGFTHGVMNTDNMSILGLTIDYGPFGFMDHYEPGYVCNHSDNQGRYAFDQQPDVGAWNLSRLAQAFTPLITTEEAKEALQDYPSLFASHYITLMSAKLGLITRRDNTKIILSMLDILHKNKVDYTIFLRKLCTFDPAPEADNASLRDLFLQREDFDNWAEHYRHVLTATPQDYTSRNASMRACNPKYILRNYIAENAIRAVRDQHDLGEIERLMRILQTPFDEHPDMEAYAAEPPDWARHLELSCSS